MLSWCIGKGKGGLPCLQFSHFSPLYPSLLPPSLPTGTPYPFLNSETHRIGQSSYPFLFSPSFEGWQEERKTKPWAEASVG